MHARLRPAVGDAAAAPQPQPCAARRRQRRARHAQLAAATRLSHRQIGAAVDRLPRPAQRQAQLPHQRRDRRSRARPGVEHRQHPRRDLPPGHRHRTRKQLFRPDSVAPLHRQCARRASRRTHRRCGKVRPPLGRRRIAVERRRSLQRLGGRTRPRHRPARQPRRAAPRIERRRQPRVDVGRHARDSARPARAARQSHRPGQRRRPLGDRHAQRRLHAARDTVVQPQRLADQRDISRKAVVQPPAPADLQPQHARRRFDPQPRILGIDEQRRQREGRRLARRRRQQPVDRPERQLAAHPARAQPDMPRPHADHLGAVEPDPRLRLQPVGDEVGVGGIAEHHVLQPLPPRPEGADRIARRHAQLRQFAVDDARRDRPPHAPQRDQRRQHHQRHAERDAAAPAERTEAPSPAGQRLARRVGGIVHHRLHRLGPSAGAIVAPAPAAS